MALSSKLEQPLTRAEWLRDKMEERRRYIQALVPLEDLLIREGMIQRRACVSGKRKAREAHSPSAPTSR